MVPPFECIYITIIVGNLIVLQQAPTIGGLHKTEKG